jgi:hypothetical protein
MMDEAAFRNDIASDAFQAGVLEGFWEIPPEAAGMAWPHFLIKVASSLSTVPAGGVTLRFTLDGYPNTAPTAVPWDLTKNAPLAPADWPKGEGLVAQAFKPGWNNALCLYIPCDRGAMAGHDVWKTQHPHYYWQPTFTIVRYLECVRRCLNPLRHETANK